MIQELLIKKAFDNILKYISKIEVKNTQKLLFDKTRLENSITQHTNFVKNWSCEISFKDLQKSKQLEKVFVDLNLYLTPRKTQLLKEGSFQPLDSIFQSTDRNLVILGNPGAGKTTSMKYICNKVLYDEKFLNSIVSFPVVIRLKDLNVIKVMQNEKSENSVESIFFHLYQIFDVQIEIQSKNDSYIINQSNYADHYILIKNIILKLLDDLKVLLILDGIDEIPTNNKKNTLNEIQNLSIELNHAKLILTCRTGDYNVSIPNTIEFEICELNDTQIQQFINKWILDESSARKLYNQIVFSPFKDTLARPLTIAHLCAIYERYGKIPDKPKTLYKKIVMLLIEEWDAQRNILRSSGYSNFESDRKFEFLCHLAFELTTNLKSLIFSKREFENAYKNICENFGLPTSQASNVAIELESHTGLFLQTSYDEFEFAHKSIQEYLAAEYLVKLPQIPFDNFMLISIPNELALAVSISSNPTMYFSSLLLVNLQINKSSNAQFANVFLSRILVEKPDFIADAILGISFFYLVESFFDIYHSMEFVNFFHENKVSDSIALALKYYHKDAELVAKKDKYIALRKVNEYANEVTSCLPEIIEVHMMFIVPFDSEI